MPYSPAEEAGIESGDYILSVDGQEVTSPMALKKAIEGMKPMEAAITIIDTADSLTTTVETATGTATGRVQTFK